MGKKLIEMPVCRKWYTCPSCGTKLLIYDNTAKSSGVYIKCRTCKKEIEVII